jgi:uncharacterized cupredoxin-like copper-binding protein
MRLTRGLLLAASTAVLGTAIVLLLARGHVRTARAAGGTVLGVTERNFRISLSAPTVAAGDVTLRIHNAGPDRHELIMLPLRQGEPVSGLPLRQDGFTVDEERLQGQEPGAIDPRAPGATTNLTVHLQPGAYVLFCNMEGHYMAGMHAELVVR